ncbi:MAG: phosphorylase, partial [Bacteroidetes bacterium]
FVGDQERVPHVSKYFDRIEVQKNKREFVTHTGYIGNKRLSVISTGIGTDNIDIVMNELDALVNVDLSTKTIKENLKSLHIVRIGTSGALQEDVAVDSVLISSFGLGLDGLMQFYDYEETDEIAGLLTDIDEQLGLLFVNPYLFKAGSNLLNRFTPHFATGITATCCGFYGPQGRMLRAEKKYENLIEKLNQVQAGGNRITNFEMETAGIYGMAALLGHEALSVNAILANRINHTFSRNPEATVEATIKQVLEVLTGR